MIELAILPVVVALGILVLVWGHYEVVLAAQPLRLQLAEKGEQLLAKEGLPPFIRAQTEFILRTAFGSGRQLFVCAIMAIPVMVTLLFQRAWFTQMVQAIESLDAETKQLRTEVIRLHNRITLANNPVLFMIVNLEVLVFSPIGLFLFAIFRKRLPLSGDSDTLIAAIEMRKARLNSNHLRHA